AVPEFFHYEDTGCEVSLSCLNCPLPQCKYDDPAWFQRYQRLSKDLIVLTAMQSENLTVDEAAERFSVTVRTIFRIMRRCREAPPELEEQELGALAAD
ncbi:MAG: transposase family protein, partial [Stenotrophomonas maltophilia]